MTAVLTARRVGKSFDGIVALRDAELDVYAGERVGLIGPNGAGKTTLFNCLLGVLRPEVGTVRLDGRDVTRLPVYRRARLGMGRTFQRLELFSETTVLDHLLVADRAHRRSGSLWRDLAGLGRPRGPEVDRCLAVLDLLGISGLAGEPIERLSLGQARLVEVGRALMTEPRVLLLDEPSSGLDRGETDALAGTLTELQADHDLAVVLVEHDVDMVAAFTQRTYVLDAGAMLASGPTAEVLADARVREAYLGPAVGP